MTIYALIHDTAGDRVASYDGMDQTTVTGLLTQTGFTFGQVYPSADHPFSDSDGYSDKDQCRSG